ncbi:hypothetical protein GCM10010327_39820 [Streptomyces nitrosporeus]|nr:hypothetical protein GCM10010327_39820 [Streptomyces nitrosporeus]
MNNGGDRVVLSTATGTPALDGPVSGAVGLSTWATSASCDDVRVTSEDGRYAPMADDFSGAVSAGDSGPGTGDLIGKVVNAQGPRHAPASIPAGPGSRPERGSPRWRPAQPL